MTHCGSKLICLSCGWVFVIFLLLMLQTQGIFIPYKSTDVAILFGVIFTPFTMGILILCWHKKCDKQNEPGQSQNRSENQNRETTASVNGSNNSGICVPVDDPPSFKCYLCLKPVDLVKWKNGSHRRACKKSFSGLLKSLPTPLNVSCPHCRKMLKLFPNLDAGAVFTCNASPNCPLGPEAKPNRGNDRFNCFRCDYDLCRDCAEREIGLLPQIHRPWEDPNTRRNDQLPSYEQAIEMEDE